VILDTNGNIFGGFTPVKWESPRWNGKKWAEDNRWRGDSSQKSFLFTLKNPHNIPARRFVLKETKKHHAIWCVSERGPDFGGGSDIAVLDDCNTNTKSFTHFGTSYTNDTGLSNDEVLTGSKYFQVKEIEVFEITD
jgi:hypothetical protein